MPTEPIQSNIQANDSFNISNADVKKNNSTELPLAKILQANELSELLLDNSQPWKVHNCKLLKNECSNQGTLPFIYHYDKLSDALKHEYPLNGSLLANFNNKMTAEQACELIGVSTDSIASPKFVKITGTVVVFHEPLQLAVRLHWSNTSKSADEIYCETDDEAMKLAMKKWLFMGRVDTLYKQNKPKIAVYDDENGQYILVTGHTYEPMPHDFSVSLIADLHANQDKLDWVDKAIQLRVG